MKVPQISIAILSQALLWSALSNCNKSTTIEKAEADTSGTDTGEGSDGEGDTESDTHASTDSDTTASADSDTSKDTGSDTDGDSDTPDGDTESGETDGDEEPERGNDLNNSAYFGYQCWHFAQGDGRDTHPDIKDSTWSHWFNSSTSSSFADIHGDMWPDFRNYEATGVPLYKTQMRYPNGNTVKVYSCWDYETVDLHIKWLSQYGLKGVFFQRQALNIDNAKTRAESDQVVVHLWRACEKYNVKFSMMPCNNYKDKPGDDVEAMRQRLVDNIVNDWKYIVDELRLPGKPNYRIIDSPMYMYQKDRNGIARPAIGLWGLGQDNRPMTAGDAQQILDAFHNSDEYHVYIMGGVPVSWRTAPKSPAWVKIYKQLDMISPWRTIFAIQSADSVQQTMRDDMAYCYDNGMDYNPVVSAGASTRHLRDDPAMRNWKPRLAGQHFWNQVYEIERGFADVESSRKLPKRSLPRFLYLAMLDEIDEGTALYKQAEAKADLPANDTGDPTKDLVPLNEDGTRLSSDFYLRLSKAAQEVTDGSRPLTDVVPIAER